MSSSCCCTGKTPRKPRKEQSVDVSLQSSKNDKEIVLVKKKKSSK